MAPFACTHARLPTPRPTPRLLHNEGEGLVCATCGAIIEPGPSDSIGRTFVRVGTVVWRTLATQGAPS